MKVLVTGGSGFLGSHIVEQLIKAGHEVRALVRKTSNTKFLKSLEKVELVEGSVESRGAVNDAVKGVDGVVHSAGLVKARNEEEYRATNVEGTRNLIDAAVEHGVKRFVHVSSLEAAGPSRPGGEIGLEQAEPVTRYGHSKLAAERVVLSAKDKLTVVVIRPGGIYGPRDNEMFEMFRTVKRGALPLSGDGSVRVSVIYGPDCAALCVRALERDGVATGSVYFATDDRVYTQRELAEGIETAMKKRALIRYGTPLPVVAGVASLVEAYGRLTNKAVMLTREKARMLGHDWVCSSAAAQKDLDWKPEVPWLEGARLTADWYQKNGWL